MTTKQDYPSYLPPSKGTILKFLVTADLGGGIHMSDVDFYCEFFSPYTRQMLRLDKSDLKYVSDDEYIAVVDTAIVGTGEYYMQFTAFIPDEDVDNGLRRESVTVATDVKVR